MESRTRFTAEVTPIFKLLLLSLLLVENGRRPIFWCEETHPNADSFTQRSRMQKREMEMEEYIFYNLFLLSSLNRIHMMGKWVKMGCSYDRKCLLKNVKCRWWRSVHSSLGFSKLAAEIREVMAGWKKQSSVRFLHSLFMFAGTSLYGTIIFGNDRVFARVLHLKKSIKLVEDGCSRNF